MFNLSTGTPERQQRQPNNTYRRRAGKAGAQRSNRRLLPPVTGLVHPLDRAFHSTVTWQGARAQALHLGASTSPWHRHFTATDSVNEAPHSLTSDLVTGTASHTQRKGIRPHSRQVPAPRWSASARAPCHVTAEWSALSRGCSTRPVTLTVGSRPDIEPLRHVAILNKQYR